MEKLLVRNHWVDAVAVAKTVPVASSFDFFPTNLLLYVNNIKALEPRKARIILCYSIKNDLYNDFEL